MDLEIQKGGGGFRVATPTSGHVKVQTEYLEATLGLVKRLEISKELIRECVTVPGCCCCMPLLHNHLMDSCSYVHKNTLLAAKGGCTCTHLTPLNLPLIAYGSHHTSAMKQNLCHLLNSACLYTTVSTCIHGQSYGRYIGTHTPAAYSKVAATTTAVPCTVSVHALAVLYKKSSFKLTLDLAV